MVEEVLPQVPCASIVFTIPKMLRRFFIFDRTLYGELSRVAYASTKEFLQEHFSQLDNPVPAMIVAPQSFGNLLNCHAHCHSLCSVGVFDRDGNFHSADDLDFSPLEEIFRQRTLQMMLEKEKITEERVQLLLSWEHSGFHIDANRRIPAGDKESLESVLQYFERPPVSMRRLTYLAEDGRVLYKGKHNPSLGRDYQLVSPVEFLAMLVPHISLRYEVTIRSYGALSTTIRKRFGWIESGLQPAPQNTITLDDDKEGEETEFVRARRRNWARLIRKVWLVDPEVCSRCGSHMVVLAAISSPEQDAVIERILRSRGEWDPPWLRQRPPRGPPKQSELFTQQCQLPTWAPEDENQDPPGDAWLH